MDTDFECDIKSVCHGLIDSSEMYDSRGDVSIA